MLKLIVTDAGVSKGYGENPTLRFSGGEGAASVRFRIGKRVYDSRCEGSNRWLNLNVKAFGEVCERIRKMKLKEGSYVNIIGRYDEESWTDKNTGELRTTPVLIVDEIEYCYSGNGKKGEQTGDISTEMSTEQSERQQYDSGRTSQEKPETPPPMPDNFTGFEGFGGDSNPFYCACPEHRQKPL